MSANESTPVYSFPCCDLMKESLHEDNSPKQGFHEVELTNIKTFAKRRVGIALRMPDKRTKVFINFCPFCGARHEAQA